MSPERTARRTVDDAVESSAVRERSFMVVDAGLEVVGSLSS